MIRKLIREQALKQATRLFWKHGYNGTSMAMLTKELGVEKPSIYAEFGNKRSLFLEALLYYRTNMVAQVSRLFAAKASPRAGIEQVVRFMMMSLYEPEMQDGCLISNAALELADHDAEVAQHVATMLAEVTAAFERAILEAQQQGEVNSKVSAAVLASFLVNTIQGTRIVEKTRPDKDAQNAMVDFVLKTLDT